MNKLVKVTALLVLINLIVFGQDANTVMTEIQKKFSTIENFQSDFIQSTSSSGFNNSFNMSGKFLYQNPNKFKIDLENQIIVSDGETIWNYDQKLNRVVVNNVSDDPSAFSIENYVYEYPKNCELKLLSSDPEETVVRLIPKNSSLQFNYVDLTVNGKRIIQKIELLDLNNLKMTVELKNTKINADFSETNFNFSPPEGSKIIDFR